MYSDFIKGLIDVLGSDGVLQHPTELEPYLTDWRAIFKGQALAVVFPKTSSEVQTIVQLCQEFAIAIVPQGGNTNLNRSTNRFIDETHE